MGGDREGLVRRNRLHDNGFGWHFRTARGESGGRKYASFTGSMSALRGSH